MSEALPNEAVDPGPEVPRRGPGRPPKTPQQVATAANEAMAVAVAEFEKPAEPTVLVVISVKPSFAWQCPWVDGAITQPKQQLRVPLSLAKHMEANEQAIILENENG